MVQESLAPAVAALDSLRAELAKAIGKAKTARAAKSAIAKVVAAHANSQELQDALMQPMAMADMAGQLMVKTYEAGPERLTLAVGDAQDPRTFLNLPWPEALDAWRKRVASKGELATLLKGYEETARASQALVLEQVQTRVNDLLAEAIYEGQTFKQFADALAGEAPGLGITNQDPSYLQMVFRTNVLGAYGRGRHTAQQDPDVIEARPYRQWRTTGDSRVRPEHAAFADSVWRADNPAMANLHAPGGYQCRCSVVSLESWGGELVESVPPDLIQEGFE